MADYIPYLLGVIRDIEDALNIPQAVRETSNGSVELVVAIRRLQEKIATLEASLKHVQSAAISGMNAAHTIASHDLATAKRLHAESRPEAIESERSANAMLTAENERLTNALEKIKGGPPNDVTNAEVAGWASYIATNALRMF